MSYVWTPSRFNFFPFFFLFCFLLQFWSFMVQIRLGQGTGAERQLSEHSHREPFLFHLPSPAGQGVSILSRSHRAGGAGRPAGRRRKVRFLTGLSAQSHQRPSAPKQGYALSGAGLTLGRLRAGPPDNTKGGAFLGRLWGFSFASCFFKSRDTTLIKNMSFIPREILCQATLKNLLPSTSWKSIFFLIKCLNTHLHRS